MSPYALLAVAITAEILATTALKLSEGFSRPGWVVVVVVGYVTAFGALGQALSGVPIGLAYALWSGFGTIGVVAIGAALFGEPLDLTKVAGITLILAGAAVLNGAGTHA